MYADNLDSTFTFILVCLNGRLKEGWLIPTQIFIGCFVEIKTSKFDKINYLKGGFPSTQFYVLNEIISDDFLLNKLLFYTMNKHSNGEKAGDV